LIASPGPAKRRAGALCQVRITLRERDTVLPAGPYLRRCHGVATSLDYQNATPKIVSGRLGSSSGAPDACGE
jgi:hypothetical protein